MRRPEIVFLLVLVVLATGALATRYWTRLPTDAEVVALEEAITGLPGVAAAESSLSGRGVASSRDLYVRVDLDGDIGPDSAATAVTAVVDLLSAEAFAHLDGMKLTLSAGEGRHFGSGYPSQLLEVDFRDRPGAAGLADEVRRWRELGTRYSRVAVRVTTDEDEGVRDRSVSIEFPGTADAAVDTVLELGRLAWSPVPEPPYWGVGTGGLSFWVRSSFPPVQVAETVRSLTGLPEGLVAPDDHTWVIGRWDGASGCLRVEVAVALAEFRDVPVPELDAARVRARTAGLTGEHLARLDASGVPYSYRAYVSGDRSGSEAGDLDVLEVGGCSAW